VTATHIDCDERLTAGVCGPRLAHGAINFVRAQVSGCRPIAAPPQQCGVDLRNGDRCNGDGVGSHRPDNPQAGQGRPRTFRERCAPGCHGQPQSQRSRSARPLPRRDRGRPGVRRRAARCVRRVPSGNRARVTIEPLTTRALASRMGTRSQGTVRTATVVSGATRSPRQRVARRCIGDGQSIGTPMGDGLGPRHPAVEDSARGDTLAHGVAGAGSHVHAGRGGGGDAGRLIVDASRRGVLLPGWNLRSKSVAGFRHT
jgi:hypothetical protein